MEQILVNGKDELDPGKNDAAGGNAEITESVEGLSEATDFEEFLKQFPEADAEKTIKGVIESGDFRKGGFTRQYVKSLREDVERLKRENDSEEVLIKKARENKAVSEEIVKEYLMRVSENKKALKKRINGVAPAMPPAKPKTVSEAGKLASEFFIKNLK